MASYFKHMATLKQLSSGFAQDGTQIGGVVKAESYGGTATVCFRPVNLSPVSGGRLVYAIHNGERTELLESAEGVIKNFNLSRGFCAVVVFVSSGLSAQILPVGCAICGGITQTSAVLADIERREKATNFDKKIPADEYQDDAIAESNYYEYDRGDETCAQQAAKQAENGACSSEDEAPERLGKKQKETAFYERVKDGVEELLRDYVRFDALEGAISGSEIVVLPYSRGKNYYFGWVKEGGVVARFCYAVSATKSGRRPKGFAYAQKVTGTDSREYWVLYQNAVTGEEIKG